MPAAASTPFTVHPNTTPSPAGSRHGFRALLAEHDWQRLSAAARRRFSRRIRPGENIVFRGRNLHTRRNPAGRLLTLAARLIGSPLPDPDCDGLASTVSVSAGAAPGSQVWSRRYHRRAGPPQLIRSTKRFAGPTGLEEDLGQGVGMALRLSSEAGRLVFRSEHFFIHLGTRRLRLPAWLGPGRLTVTHTDLSGRRFQFGLHIDHPWFGRLIDQRAVYEDRNPC